MARREPPHGPHIAAVPRYAYGEALRGALTLVRSFMPGGTAAARTAGELPAWHLAGRLYGRWLLRDQPGRSVRASRSGIGASPSYADDAPAID
jgi:hypothetical protein